MLTRLALALSLLTIWNCSDDSSRPDGAADLGAPDVPPVKLDQKPLLTDGSVDSPSNQDLAQAQIHNAPFFLDFEQNDGQLAGTRDWEWGQLAFVAGSSCDTTTYYPPSAGHSGSGMWGTKLNDCYSPLENAQSSCSNGSVTDDSVLTLKVSLPSTLPSPRLTYWEWADYFLTFDWTEIRVDGVVVHQTCTGSLPVPPTWEKRSLDLKPYVGQTISITFHFMASGVVNYSGWYLDDLAVNSD